PAPDEAAAPLVVHDAAHALARAPRRCAERVAVEVHDALRQVELRTKARERVGAVERLEVFAFDLQASNPSSSERSSAVRSGLKWSARWAMPVPSKYAGAQPRWMNPDGLKRPSSKNTRRRRQSPRGIGSRHWRHAAWPRARSTPSTRCARCCATLARATVSIFSRSATL